MAKIDDDLRDHLGKQLRRVFRYSPLKRLASQVWKNCKVCGTDKNIEIDHAIPVAPVDREVGALEYFLRMFCMSQEGNVNIHNLVALCSKCHKLKSGKEIKDRAKFKTGPYSAKAKEKRKLKFERKAITKIKNGRAKKHVSARRKKAKRRSN